MKTSLRVSQFVNVLALQVLTLATLLAGPLDHWHLRNPDPALRFGALTSVAWGDGLFIAVGTDGRILKSSDGATWIERSSGISDNFTGIDYGNGLFIALAGSRILTSPDGDVWTERAPTSAQQLFDVAYGNGVFVAVGSRADGTGAVFTSPDGVAWTSRETGAAGELYSIAFGDGLFVTVGSQNTLLTSADGLTWTARNSGAQGLSTNGPATLADVAFANHRWVVVGGGTGGPGLSHSISLWVTSTDGTSWTPHGWAVGSVLGSGAMSNMTQVCWNGEFFFAAGWGDGVSGGWISADGVAWNDAGSNPGGTGLIFAEGQFVATGYIHTSDPPRCTLKTSPDLVVWTDRLETTSSSVSTTFFGVAAGNGLLVAAGGWSAVLQTSANGIVWPSLELATLNPGMTGLAYGKGIFLGVSRSGYVLTSPDGEDWLMRGGLSSQWLQEVTFAGSLFVAVGDRGTILTSTSGSLWYSRLPQTSQDLFGVAYGNGRFVAVGNQGAVVVSDDGADWGYAPQNSTWSFADVAFGHGAFVAVGPAGLILTSADGEQWTARSSGTVNDLLGVNFVADRFLALGKQGTLLVSDDGLAWTPLDCGTSTDLVAAAAAFDSIFVVGSGSTILQSDPLTNPAPHIVVGPSSQAVAPGATVGFEVAAQGTSPLGYQWFKDDVMILNATNQSLALFDVQATDAGRYTVVVRNPIGTSPPSAPATLSLLVDDMDGDGYLDYDERRLMTDPADPASHPESMPIGVFTGGDAGEGLDLDGQFVYAVNIGATGPIGQIRDAGFTGDTVEGVTVTFGHSAAGWHDPVFGTTEADGILESILSTIRYSFADNPTNSNLAVTMSGLHPGSRYQLQLLFAEHGWPRGFDVFIDDRQFLDDFSPAHYQGGYDKTRGVVVTYGFTARESALSVVLDGRNVTATEMTDHNPFLQGLTLEDLGPAPMEIHINHVEFDGMGVHLTVNTQVGQRYALQYRASLVSGTWDELPPVTASGTSTVLTDDLADHRTPATGFWRVVLAR